MKAIITAVVAAVLLIVAASTQASCGRYGPGCTDKETRLMDEQDVVSLCTRGNGTTSCR